MLDSMTPGASGKAKGSGILCFREGSISVFNRIIGVHRKISECDISIDVDFDDVLTVVKKLKGTNPIEFSIEDKKLVLKCGKSRYQIIAYESDVYTELTSILLVDEELMVPTTKDLAEGIETVLFSEKKPTDYSGVFIEGRLALTTDLTMITDFEFRDDYPKMWLTRESAQLIYKHIYSSKDSLMWAKVGSWLYLRDHDTTFILLCLNVESDPFLKIINVQNEVFNHGTVIAEVTLPPKAEYLERVTFQEDSIHVTVSKATIELSSSKLARVQASEEVKGKVKWSKNVEPYITGYVRSSHLKYCLEKANKFEVVETGNRFVFCFYSDFWSTILMFNTSEK